MCKKLTVNYVEVLGTRRIGWQLWDGCQMQGMTDAQIRSFVHSGGVVNGLLVTDDEQVVPDPVWGGVVLEKSGINTFKPLDAEADLMATKSFMLVKVSRNGKESIYHFITNRWQIESMSEDKVRAILTLMPMGGIQLDGKRLAVHGNVEVVDAALQE